MATHLYWKDCRDADALACMFRVWPLLIVVFVLAACSSAPTRHDSASAISTPRAWKPPADLPAFIDHSVGEEEISIQAMSLVGVPYRWGGNTPDAGFDCSGLVRYVVARSARVDLPRTTAEMSLVGSAIQPDEVAPGDLIYFNTTGRPHSHVGIYVGGYRFVNAPSTGGTVRIDYVSNPYWAKRFDGIRRVASVNRPATPFDAPQLITSVNPESAAPKAAQPTRAAYAVPNASGAANAGAAAVSSRTEVETGTATATLAPRASVESDSAESALRPVQPASRRAVESEPVATQRRLTTAPVDAFEPPPPSRTAAESQAAAEHATNVDPIAAFAGAREETDAPTATHSTPSYRSSEAGQPSSVQPPTVSAPTPVAPAMAPAMTPPGDDPIARFANGG